MVDEPCHVIPIPKRMDLEWDSRPWPGRIDVSCDADCASPLTHRYETELTGHGDPLLKIQLVHARCRPGGYALAFRSGELTVSAADTAGFRHALETARQIASKGAVLTGTVSDWPALAIRGFHLNFASYRRLDVEQALQLIRTAARFKLNTILVEYGPRFPFESHPHIRDAASLTPDEIERLNHEANDHGIQIIPLQQSLAHLEYALNHDALSHLRERPEKPGLMCPSDPGSLELFKTLAAEVIKLHPQAKWFHLGGDEARKIGHCSRCATVANDRGRGALYGRHIGDAARWLLAQGLRPIVWDDTLCAFPSAFEYLPKDTLVDYWDYIAVADPTPVLIPRMAHVEGAPRVAHDWRWTLRSKRVGVCDVQAEVMKNYSHPTRLKAALGGKFMGEFGRYLGKGFPRWIRALPYLEYYQDRGHDVITSPTGMGNGDSRDGTPNFQRFEHNIRIHASRCKSNGKALGMITTAWYNMPPELLYQPIIRTGQCAW